MGSETAALHYLRHAEGLKTENAARVAAATMNDHFPIFAMDFSRPKWDYDSPTSHHHAWVTHSRSFDPDAKSVLIELRCICCNAWRCWINPTAIDMAFAA